MAVEHLDGELDRRSRRWVGRDRSRHRGAGRSEGLENDVSAKAHLWGWVGHRVRNAADFNRGDTRRSERSDSARPCTDRSGLEHLSDSWDEVRWETSGVPLGGSRGAKGDDLVDGANAERSARDRRSGSRGLDRSLAAQEAVKVVRELDLVLSSGKAGDRRDLAHVVSGQSRRTGASNIDTSVDRNDELVHGVDFIGRVIAISQEIILSYAPLVAIKAHRIAWGRLIGDEFEDISSSLLPCI